MLADKSLSILNSERTWAKRAVGVVFLEGVVEVRTGHSVLALWVASQADAAVPFLPFWTGVEDPQVPTTAHPVLHCPPGGGRVSRSCWFLCV